MRIETTILAIAVTVLSIAAGFVAAVFPEVGLVTVGAAIASLVLQVLLFRRPSVWREAESSARVASIVMIAFAATWSDFWRFGPAWRYGLLGGLIAAALISGHRPHGLRFRRPSSPLALAILTPLVMTLFSLFAGRNTVPGLVLWFPLLTLLSAFLQSERSGASMLASVQLVKVSALIFAGSAALERLAKDSDFVLSTHEGAFVLLGIFAWSFHVRSWVLCGVTGFVIMASFLSYPAATFVVAALAILLWLVIFRSSAVVRNSAIAVSLGLLAITVGNFREWVDAYFRWAEKGNNSSTRLALAERALGEIQEHVLMGKVMGGEFTQVAYIDARWQPVPTHNAVLTVALAGGLVLSIALIALWIWLAATTYAVGRDGPEVRKLAILSGSVLLGGIITAMFNPILENLQLATLFYAVSGLVVSLQAPSNVRKAQSVGSAHAPLH